MKDLNEFLEESFGQNAWSDQIARLALGSRGALRDSRQEALDARQRYRADPEAARAAGRKRQADYRARHRTPVPEGTKRTHRFTNEQRRLIVESDLTAGEVAKAFGCVVSYVFRLRAAQKPAR